MVTTWSGGDPFALVAPSRSRAQSDLAARGSRTVVSATVWLSVGELDAMQSKLPWAPQGATYKLSAAKSKGRTAAKHKSAAPRAVPGGQSANAQFSEGSAATALEDIVPVSKADLLKEEATQLPEEVSTKDELEKMLEEEMAADQEVGVSVGPPPEDQERGVPEQPASEEQKDELRPADLCLGVLAPQLKQEVFCSRCMQVADPYRAVLAGKSAGSWKCNVCNTRMVQLARAYGKWPPPEFRVFTQEEQASFYQSLAGCSNSTQVVSKANVFLERKRIETQMSSSSGEYLPLSVYERRGYSIEDIVSKCNDRMEHPVLGTVYRIAIASRSSSTANVQEARHQLSGTLSGGPLAGVAVSEAAAAPAIKHASPGLVVDAGKPSGHPGEGGATSEESDGSAGSSSSKSSNSSSSSSESSEEKAKRKRKNRKGKAERKKACKKKKTKKAKKSKGGKQDKKDKAKKKAEEEQKRKEKEEAEQEKKRKAEAARLQAEEAKRAKQEHATELRTATKYLAKVAASHSLMATLLADEKCSELPPATMREANRVFEKLAKISTEAQAVVSSSGHLTYSVADMDETIATAKSLSALVQGLLAAVRKHKA